MIKNKKALTLAIVIPLAVGALSSLLSGGMSVYSEINKPALAPPGFLFPIVWIILYILMGLLLTLMIFFTFRDVMRLFG